MATDVLESHFCQSTIRIALRSVLDLLVRTQLNKHRDYFPASTARTILCSAIAETLWSLVFRPELVGVPGCQNTYQWELLESPQPQAVEKEVETQKEVLSNVIASARELQLGGDAYEEALPLGAVKRAEDIVKRCRLHGVRIARKNRTGVGHIGTLMLLVV